MGRDEQIQYVCVLLWTIFPPFKRCNFGQLVCHYICLCFYPASFLCLKRSDGIFKFCHISVICVLYSIRKFSFDNLVSLKYYILNLNQVSSRCSFNIFSLSFKPKEIFHSIGIQNSLDNTMSSFYYSIRKDKFSSSAQSHRAICIYVWVGVINYKRLWVCVCVC